MEKFSKQHNAFFDAIKNVEKSIADKAHDPKVRALLRPAKVLHTPGNIPAALLTYGLAKHASDMPEDINPIKLKNFLVDHYKADWLEWLPEVTDKTVFGDRDSEALSNKVQSIRICLTTDTPWLEWHIFENVGKSFNHQIPDFHVMQPLTLGECITTMDTMKKLRPEEDFSEEVLSYVASVAANNNFVYLPDDLLVGKAQPILRKLTKDFNSFAFVEMVDHQWGRLQGRKLLDAKFSEDSNVHQQIAKLALVQQYYREFVE